MAQAHSAIAHACGVVWCVRDVRRACAPLAGWVGACAGVEISSRGRVTKHGDGTRECNYFATIAGDGKVRPSCQQSAQQSSQQDE